MSLTNPSYKDILATHSIDTVAVQPDMFHTEVESSSDIFLLPNQISADAYLVSCALPYQQQLKLSGKSEYTVHCFLSDLKIFTLFVGENIRLRAITKEHLIAWLMHLKFGSVRAPAPKTMARRVTFLKNFFGWLVESDYIVQDPSAALVLERPLPPLPELLTDDELQQLLLVAQDDVRSSCLIYLVLYTGLKKEELLGLYWTHIHLYEQDGPVIEVHYSRTSGKQHRERILSIPREIISYLEQYFRMSAQEKVFDCTERNLSYILAKTVALSGIRKRITLQSLRDLYAVRRLRAGASSEEVQDGLGLSDEAWMESKEKYQRLAFPV